MQLTKEEKQELTNSLLDMGERLLESGAEISRVEDTISRMAVSYGVIHTDVFAITSIISLSLVFPDEEMVTETRRVYESNSRDFYRLEKLNALSRECCREPLPVNELREKIRTISESEISLVLQLFACVLGAGGFAVFFGGSLWDALAAAGFGMGICLMQHFFGKTKISPVGMNLIISFIAGLGVGILCAFVPALHMDKVMIGDIMLLIPGMAMTNSVQNILGGNTISGLVRLTESLIWAVALAGGFMTAIAIVDRLI